MLVIKFRCRGTNLNSLAGLLLLFIWGLHSSIHCGRSFHIQYIVASVSYTGSLGPSSRDIRGRVSPLGQPHLMSDEWRSMRCRSCSFCYGIGQGNWPVLPGCIYLFPVPPPTPRPAVEISLLTHSSSRHREGLAMRQSSHQLWVFTV